MAPNSRPPPRGDYRRRDNRDATSSRPPTRSSSSAINRGGGDASLPPRPSSPARGRNGSRSHRPNGRDSQDSRHEADYQARYRRDSYAPPPPPEQPPPPPPSSRYNNYRPPEGEFTFRVERPAGIKDSSDRYRPNEGRHDYERNSGRRQSPRRHDGRSQPSFRSRPPRGPLRQGSGRFPNRPYRPFVPAERELLSRSHSNGLEREFFDADGGVKYRPVDELSDSDEAEMDISGDEGDASGEPSAKRARVFADQNDSEDNIPKWSNPDPYTALPPPDRQKRKDVVQMIRKARVVKEPRSSIPAESLDFIPCDFDSDSDEESELETKNERKPAPGVAGAPTGPRASFTQPSLSNGNVPQTASVGIAGLPPRPPDNVTQNLPKPDFSGIITPSGPQNDLNLPPPPYPSNTSRKGGFFPDPTPSALGSRKRTHDDEIKLPEHAKLKKVNKMPVRGSLSADWKPVDGEDPCPWNVTDHSNSVSLGVWLHKEIMDFYELVKPQDFEERIRAGLVEELKGFVREIFRDAEVYPFGSFPSGLYLPTGDMDLVFLSDQFKKGGEPKYHRKNTLFRLKSTVLRWQLAHMDDVELILHAKVPLVKYIDKRTGLKMDISFENSTGLEAISTFKVWREQYPAMPILVTLIKHFLFMRGLNEPVNGGIGGFSVICLVVSMFQLMPQVQSRNMNTLHHLNDLLVEFLDLYGNRFNYRDVAISLNPPKYIAKNKVKDFTYKNLDRLSIIDPNRPDNDISGGSANVPTIFSLFSEAHALLTERMAALSQSPDRQHASILEVLFAGNYKSFRTQREHLHRLAKEGPKGRGRGNAPQPSRR